MLDAFERDVQAIARRITEAAGSEQPRVYHLGWWSERLLEWAMAHPRFKTQLFRFVDVFPACHDDADVLRHLEEYFDGVEMPRALRLGLGLTERVPFGAGISAAAARRNVRRMARQLIVGAAPEDALPRLERLWRAGEASTVDLLGEHIVTEAEADRYAARVTAMLEALVSATRTWPAAPLLERDPWGLVPRVNVSVKPTALTPLFAPPTAAEGLAEAGQGRPAFGSHNVRSLAYAVAYTRARGLPETAIELQLLYGMAEPIHVAVRRLGFPVRAYAPVGDLIAGMAYLVRRLLENTSNESFIRHRFAEGQALEALIPPPAARTLPEPEAEAAPRPPTDAAAPAPFVNEPRAELRRPGPRARLVAAVHEAPRAFEAPVLIEGTPVPTTDLLTSVDPGEFATAVCRAGHAGPAEAERAVDAALRALPAWRATPWRDRAATLFRAAAILRRRRTALAALEVFEAGKPLAEADADVCEAIDYCEHYGRQALRPGDGAPVRQRPGETNLYRYQPRGVGAVIAPWNFPLAIPAGMVTASLVAGNCVVFKPAEQAPGVAFRLVEILLEAGVPPGAVAFLPGMGDVGAHLVRHPDVAFVVFTGSKAVGLSIIADAAVQRPGQRHVKRVVAELGGKNAIVVDSDADLDQAVPAIVASAFAYAGQKCSAASRVIGVRPVFDALVERLAGAAAVVPVGHPRELRTVVGPLIDEDAWNRVREYRALARAEGEVVFQRDDVPGGGWYAGPTVVMTNRPHSRIATEEIFGPFLTVMRADDFDQALALANDTEYALTAGLFSRSPARIRRAAEELRAGNLYVNRAITGALVGCQPFGGYGLSGVGSKAGGPDYLLQLVEPRVVTENTIRQGFAPLEE